MEHDTLKKRARSIYRALRKEYPDDIELNFSNPVELLVATMLSAQCTDVRVNHVTQTLFKKYRSPKDYLKGPILKLEDAIKSTGFYKNKAKNIRAAMKIIVTNHDEQIPCSMDELVALPGVGRKTANVILGNAFNIPGLPVDTHVRRVSNRLGLTNNKNPEKIETDLCALIPKKEWTRFSHIIIHHGRYVCKARNPQCKICKISNTCEFLA